MPLAHLQIAVEVYPVNQIENSMQYVRSSNVHSTYQ